MKKQQIFDAALKYAQEQNPGKNKAAVEPDCDFIAGAMWAADEMDTLIEAKQVVISGYQKMLSAKMAELSRLRVALEEIIDRYEAANMLAGNDPVIEKAKSALWQPHST